MSEKRFIFVDNIFKYLETGIKDNKSDYDSLNGESVVDLLNEQQATINHLKQELEQYKENWDDMVELATKTSLRNVELDEQIGRLQREIERMGELNDE